ncbi:hypothetical protein HDV01_007864 [Terramyces sp. JEL0728]|nr:hypothetical protein HDV01_007864 [Terramyces sp. JEL0728]
MTDSIPTSYLLEICDYRANYLGCGSKTAIFATIDLIMILMAIASIICYLGKIVQNLLAKVLSDQQQKKKWSPMDTTCVLCFSSSVFRIVSLANTRSVAFRDIGAMTDSEIVRYVQTNIIIDFLYYAFGVAGSTVFVTSVVGASTGIDLYSDVKIGNAVIPTSKVFAVLRMVILTLLLTFNISWATLGTSTSIDNYIFFRRAGFSVSLCTIVLITAPLLIYFSNKVLDILRNSQSQNAEKGTKGSGKASKQATHCASELESEIQNEGPTPSTKDTSTINRNTTVTAKSLRKAVKVVKNTKTPLETKIANFSFAINITIWFLYFLTVVNLTLLIVGMEVPFFQQNPLALIILKIVSDSTVWVSCSFMLLYLFLC